jgi:hypothetical protein
VIRLEMGWSDHGNYVSVLDPLPGASGIWFSGRNARVKRFGKKISVLFLRPVLLSLLPGKDPDRFSELI